MLNCILCLHQHLKQFQVSNFVFIFRQIVSTKPIPSSHNQKLNTLLSLYPLLRVLLRVGGITALKTPTLRLKPWKSVEAKNSRFIFVFPLVEGIYLNLDLTDLNEMLT